MAIKQTIKRGAVRAHRKVFGKPSEVMITTDRGGLTKSEIKDVLQTLASAIKQGILPPSTYEYRPPVRILSNREPVFIIPKDGNVHKARVKIREIMKARYGTQFTVDGGKADNTPTISERSPKVSRKTPQITPKTPRLR